MLLRELGEDRGPGAGAPPADLRRRVLTGAPRRHRPAVWRLAGLGAAAVAVALAGSQALNTPAPVVPDPPSTGAVAAKPEAAVVLRLAAQHVTAAPAPTGRADQFVFVAYVQAGIRIHNQGRDDAGHRVVRVTPAPPRSVEEWRSVDGKHDGVSRSREYSSSQEWVRVPVPGCRNGRWAPTLDRPGHTESCTPQPASRPDLPTDPAAMRRYLYRAEAGSEGFGGNVPADQRAFRRATEVLRVSLLRPQVQAAVFEAVSTVPGTTVRTGARDVTGRPGVAVTRVAEGIRDELLFDPSSYAYLGANSTVVTATALSSADLRVTGLRPGDAIAREAILSAAVADTAGRRP
ncbi:hypothetical protein Ari01nite_54000 [Paractinoplanes rishiriensis]|uniref:CU044_5270 family protein n=2 Tax=Paractinoplanes rishiriensis TaxID=1050105 RepID=A0A919JZT0_9ACTN|nr:hypothetical protein Ari01nite_54000 [Actinoplanes rishiriensis]